MYWPRVRDWWCRYWLVGWGGVLVMDVTWLCVRHSGESDGQRGHKVPRLLSAPGVGSPHLTQMRNQTEGGWEWSPSSPLFPQRAQACPAALLTRWPSSGCELPGTLPCWWPVLSPKHWPCPQQAQSGLDKRETMMDLMRNDLTLRNFKGSALPGSWLLTESDF